VDWKECSRRRWKGGRERDGGRKEGGGVDSAVLGDEKKISQCDVTNGC
jgi:hypothetical protein